MFIPDPVPQHCLCGGGGFCKNMSYHAPKPFIKETKKLPIDFMCTNSSAIFFERKIQLYDFKSGV
jgi:hypothetical protein